MWQAHSLRQASSCKYERNPHDLFIECLSVLDTAVVPKLLAVISNDDDD